MREGAWLAVPVPALEGSGHGAGIVARLTARTADRARASSDADGQRLRCTRDRSARPCSTFLWGAVGRTARRTRGTSLRPPRGTVFDTRRMWTAGSPLDRRTVGPRLRDRNLGRSCSLPNHWWASKSSSGPLSAH